MILIGCTRPLLAVDYGVNPATGKKIISVLGKNSSYSPTANSQLIEIPCGQCMECRLQYARNWADRCMLEAMEHEHNYFLTLTYDDEHVPKNKDENDNDVLSLRKRDLQLFWKDLRINLERLGRGRIRYFACGEYGDQTFRPHYHAIVFGLELDDLEFYEYSKKSHEPIFISKLLTKIWANGNVFVGECTWKSCAYVARYVTKKQKGYLAGTYDKLGIDPEFVVMSRRPGIAARYYDSHKSMFEYGAVHIPTPDGGLRVKPPRYFEKLLEVDDPVLLYDYKARQQVVGAINNFAKLQSTDLDYYEYLRLQEQNAADRIKIFRRDTI